MKSASRILVVDDNMDAADMAATLLRELGHAVETAYDGLAALERAEELKPEIVFLDLDMPDVDGFAVARLLRAQTVESVRIIALTGLAYDAFELSPAAMSFDGHITKPASSEDLVKAIESRPLVK